MVEIIASDRHGLALVLPARGVDPEALGLPLMGIAPGQWLAFAADAPAGWAQDLAARLDPLATVIDQSSAYVLFTLVGRDARRLLQKGLSIDLDALAADAVTVSAIAGSGVIVHRDRLFVARSHARAVRGWLDHARAAMAF